MGVGRCRIRSRSKQGICRLCRRNTCEVTGCRRRHGGSVDSIQVRTFLCRKRAGSEKGTGGCVGCRRTRMGYPPGAVAVHKVHASLGVADQPALGVHISAASRICKDRGGGKAVRDRQSAACIADKTAKSEAWVGVAGDSSLHAGDGAVIGTILRSSRAVGAGNRARARDRKSPRKTACTHTAGTKNLGRGSAVRNCQICYLRVTDKASGRSACIAVCDHCGTLTILLLPEYQAGVDGKASTGDTSHQAAAGAAKNLQGIRLHPAVFKSGISRGSPNKASCRDSPAGRCLLRLDFHGSLQCDIGEGNIGSRNQDSRGGDPGAGGFRSDVLCREICQGKAICHRLKDAGIPCAVSSQRTACALPEVVPQDHNPGDRMTVPVITGKAAVDDRIEYPVFGDSGTAFIAAVVPVGSDPIGFLIGPILGISHRDVGEIAGYRQIRTVPHDICRLLCRRIGDFGAGISGKIHVAAEVQKMPCVCNKSSVGRNRHSAAIRSRHHLCGIRPIGAVRIDAVHGHLGILVKADRCEFLHALFHPDADVLTGIEVKPGEQGGKGSRLIPCTLREVVQVNREGKLAILQFLPRCCLIGLCALRVGDPAGGDIIAGLKALNRKGIEVLGFEKV